jgi:hypothetical protein
MHLLLARDFSGLQEIFLGLQEILIANSPFMTF